MRILVCRELVMSMDALTIVSSGLLVIVVWLGMIFSYIQFHDL